MYKSNNQAINRVNPLNKFPIKFKIYLLVWAALTLCSNTLFSQTDTNNLDKRFSKTLPQKQYSPLDNSFPFESYKHIVEFDSLSSNVFLYETLFGRRIGQPRILSLDEYISLRQKENQQRLWDERSVKYDIANAQKDVKDDLQKLLGNGLGIDIPIPQSPIFSIFGAPQVSFNVNGNVNLSAGWQWDNNNLTSINSFSSTQSAPFFNQNIQVSTTARIGDKLKLSTDFDTERSFDFDNQLKIDFGGTQASDDDIIQRFEFGNVQMSNPNSTLIGGSQALFGIKSGFKFGPLNLTTLASQKRGEKRVLNASNGTIKNQIYLKPYDYAYNHFWLDTTYLGFYDIYYTNNPPAATPSMEPFNVNEIEVYEQTKDVSVAAQFQAVAYSDLPILPPGGRYPISLRTPPQTASAGDVQKGSFIRLDPNRYELDRILGNITIKSLSTDKSYAVAYRTGGRGSYGEFSNVRGDSNEIVILKLIYVNNIQPGYKTLWKRQMKNIYQLQGVRNVDLQNSKIKITYGIPPDTSEVYRVSGSPYIVEALGVDRNGSLGGSIQPDGQFDINNPSFFKQSTGEIIFPSTEPFRKGLREKLGGNAEQFVIDAIYDKTREEAQRDTKVGRYTISADVSGSSGANIPLGVYNLAQNSVRVISNGSPLQENVDYRVDYSFGQVTLISPRALNSASSLQIEYEQNDLFSVSQKTMLGLRADYDLFRKRNVESMLGMTLMRYGQTYQINKIQLGGGDEPFTNVMLGFDGNIKFNKVNFITKAIDALPFLKTEAPSSFSARGEWAVALPNPNNKTSLVESDLGKGAAYIDDFESGSKRQIPLGITYTLWQTASPPLDQELGITDSARNAKKANMFWFNPRVKPDENEIWPDKNKGGLQTVKKDVIELQYEPSLRGMYNSNINYDKTPSIIDSSWSGIMRGLPFYSTNLNQENMDFIEITLSVDDYKPNDSKLYFDIGRISEDVVLNGNLNTEDGCRVDNPLRDGILNPGEDVGIDGLNNDEERKKYNSTEDDPAGDDFVALPSGSQDPPLSDYKRLNGLEGNITREDGPFPNTEDLNNNSSLDLDNSYFRYELNLDPNPITNKQIVGSGKGSWRQYRIPLKAGYSKVGSPSFSNVEAIRLAIKSSSHVRIRIADMNIVGSEWRSQGLPQDSASDPKLDISFVGVDENSREPDFYTTPPGVQQDVNQIDLSTRNEQSLALTVKDLNRGESRTAVRVRPRPLDLFNYKQLKYFVHGSNDMDAEILPGTSAKVFAYIRFGWDTLNYYEYRFPLTSGWMEHVIEFSEISAIKQLKGANVNLPYFVGAKNSGTQFGILGTPSLTRIQYIAYGIENNAYPGSLTSTMWVNELRVVQAEDTKDWAAAFSTNINLADLGSIDFNFKKSNPNFHTLEERFGNRVESTNWNFNSNYKLEKFLPESFKGSGIPLIYNHTETIETPRYLNNSDVEVNGAISRALLDSTNPRKNEIADSLRTAGENLKVSDQFSLSNIKIAFPGQDVVSRLLLNNLTFGYNYSQDRERSSTIENRFSWNWNFVGRYGLNIPQSFEIKPVTFLTDVPLLDFWKDFRVNLLPSNIAFGTKIDRSRTTEKLRAVPEASPVRRAFNTNRNASFSWRMNEGGLVNLTTDYSLNASSSLSHLETDDYGRQRSGGDITSDLILGNGKLFDFGNDNSLTQSITFNTRPRIPFIPSIDRYVTPTARYKVDYTWNDILGQTLSNSSFTKSASWNSTGTLGLDIRLGQIGRAIFGDSKPEDGSLKTILRYLIKFPIFDFERLSLNFSQNNGAKNDGLIGSGGITNFWARSIVPLGSEDNQYGPGMAYQLGLLDDPHGKLKPVFTSAFPFIGFQKEQGKRAPNIYVTDEFSQKNTLSGSTDRPLWPGANLSLNWSSDFGINQKTSVTTDNAGNVTFTNPFLAGTLSRTFLSLPNILFLNLFHNDAEGVADEYKSRKDKIVEPQLPLVASAQDSINYNSQLIGYNKLLSEAATSAFEDQLESFSWIPKPISRYFPRINWRIDWNGLEKLPFFSSWTQSVSLRHAYASKYTRGFRMTDSGEVPEAQTVTRGFSPLVSLSLSGKQEALANGTLTASLSFNTTTEFSLITAARSEISQDSKNELQVSVSYQKRGFEFPLFGLNLKNDIEFQFTGSMSKNNRKRFNLTEFKPEGQNDGSTKLNLRPSIRYTMSNTVSASAFLQYDATIPDADGSKDISRSTTKIGIDMRIGISGGR